MNTIIKRIPADFICGVFAGYVIHAMYDGTWAAFDAKTGKVITSCFYTTALGAARHIQRTIFANANPNYDGTH